MDMSIRLKNNKAFQMDNVYVPICTHTFENQLESARPVKIAKEAHKMRLMTSRLDTILNRKYLFVNTSAKDKDEIYPVTVSEIAAAQQKHRLYKKKLQG